MKNYFVFMHFTRVENSLPLIKISCQKSNFTCRERHLVRIALKPYLSLNPQIHREIVVKANPSFIASNSKAEFSIFNTQLLLTSDDTSIL